MILQEKEKAKESWTSEFYPINASDACHSDIQALEHSLQKWIGLRKENLEKHGWLRKWGLAPIEVYSSTCALCQRHCENDTIGATCKTCPLYIERGAKCYDHVVMDDRLNNNPYNDFINYGLPETMIKLIQICLNKEKEKVGIK